MKNLHAELIKTLEKVELIKTLKEKHRHSNLRIFADPSVGQT